MKKAAAVPRARRIRRAASGMRAEGAGRSPAPHRRGTRTRFLPCAQWPTPPAMTYPNLSHHFGSAAGLHVAIAEDLVRELLAGLQTVDVEMNNLEHDYRAVVDRVFDLFSKNGLGRLLGWLVRSGETSRLEPMNQILSDFIASRARPSSKTDAGRISRIALIVAFAAYAESSVGPLLGGVLGANSSKRRDYFAQALAALRDH